MCVCVCVYESDSSVTLACAEHPNSVDNLSLKALRQKKTQFNISCSKSKNKSFYLISKGDLFLCIRALEINYIFVYPPWLLLRLDQLPVAGRPNPGKQQEAVRLWFAVQGVSGFGQ